MKNNEIKVQASNWEKIKMLEKKKLLDEQIAKKLRLKKLSKFGQKIIQKRFYEMRERSKNKTEQRSTNSRLVKLEKKGESRFERKMLKR